MRRPVIVVLRVILLVYAGMLIMLAGCQRQFIYYPSRASEQGLLDIARGVNMEPWRDPDDRIIGWRTSSDDDETGNVMVVFHGNAGYALHRTYFSEGFKSISRSDKWDVYIFEYPGYGARPGRPSEKAIKEAAVSAVHGLTEKGHDVYLIGESLGGGVACYLAGKKPDDIKGLFLITPFTSLVDVGRHHYPFFPVGLLLRERYDNLDALENYGGPVAFMLAERDEIIPASLGMRLYEEYDGPKKLHVQEGRTHNTLMFPPGAEWWDDISAFLLESGG